MKKETLIFLMVMIISSTLASMFSCRGEENKKSTEVTHRDSLVAFAKRGLADYIDKCTYNPETFKIRDFKVAYISDSLCILQFWALAENGFGGHINTKCEYDIIKYDGTWYDYLESKFAKDDVLAHTDVTNSMFKSSLEKDSVAKRLYKTSQETGNDYYYKAYCYMIYSYIGERKGRKVEFSGSPRGLNIESPFQRSDGLY